MADHLRVLGEDTIAAVATALTESGIGIIRVSGPDAFAVGSSLFRIRKRRDNDNKSDSSLSSAGSDVDAPDTSSGKSPSAEYTSLEYKDVSTYPANTIHFGYIVDPDLMPEEKKSMQIQKSDFSDNGAVVDEVLLAVYHHPHSYTTEDTIEINTHGGPYVMNKVLSLVLAHGARLAEPGEFTKRAFLGGRIDLSKAEAVMDLISSQNEFARKTAVAQLEGSVSDKVKEIREKILYQNAYIESALDDPENYDLTGFPEKLRAVCTDLSRQLEKMISYGKNGRVLKNGIKTVIVGKPNAGKSSLMNYLAGEERAIVTDVAGTTRDTLEEDVRIGEIVLRLIDTAGIHETQDEVEKIGVSRAKKSMDDADLILFVLDSSTGISEEDHEIAQIVSSKIKEGKRCIVVQNKSDLPARISSEDIFDLFRTGTVEKEKKDVIVNYRKIRYITCSLTEKKGLNSLQNEIERMFSAGELSQKNEVFLSNTRQLQDAQEALDSLTQVIASIDKGMSEDFFSIDLMNAYKALGRIIGEEVEDDLVEEIFSKFCLGK